ncbi:hypothetical protein PpBr36_07468 [Pyricularia pennisetigena]|uniref:hypothetical protein n=1 Tax=Pyricularia pennisetigena TaxID=1578925 RepID=UPI001150F167|nr:hypothetical protein PpBr36_07468 [Pyricularia pennisetigena]TLS25161.1 hypothetical protein PpBr36_07468 [Pyricularia pennisetigena]
MREAHLRLDSIELALRKLPVKLRVESELTLGLPDAWPTAVTPTMVSSMVAAGGLWVERASPCRLHVDSVVTSARGMIAEDYLHARRLANAIRACSAWELLGLQLSRCPRPVHENEQDVPGSLFYITHMTNSSSHLVYQYTERAEVRRLTCRFWFDFATKTVNKRPARQREAAQTAVSTDSRRVTRSGTKRSLTKTSENVATQSEQLSAAEIDRSVMILVRGSLFTLLGIKKPTPRIRRLRSFECPSLLEIAPAAFNMRYLQEVVQRAPFLNSISSVLARLVDNAQSPSLRQKVASLAMGTAEGSEMQIPSADSTQKEHCTDKDRYFEEVGKMIWPVLQTAPSKTKLYLEKLPEDRISDASVGLQPDGNCSPIHDPSQQSEMEGLTSGEKVHDGVEADANKLGLHLAVNDTSNQGNNRSIHRLDEPFRFPGSTQESEGAPFLDGEDQSLGSNAQELMQKYYSRFPEYEQSSQAFPQDDLYGDEYESEHSFDEEGDTADYHDTCYYSWISDNDNDMASAYIGLGNDYELEAEHHPYFSSSLAPRTFLGDETGTTDYYFEDEPGRADITANQDSGSESLDHFEGYDQGFVDSFGDEYVYENSHIHLTPWEWDVSIVRSLRSFKGPMNHADKTRIYGLGETRR